MTPEDKIKCVISENGTIIPIHNTSVILGKGCSHYIWTNGNIDPVGHKLTDEQYNALMKELKML